jgi:hypothetical protein
MVDMVKSPGFAMGLALGALLGVAIQYCILHPHFGGMLVRLLARISAVVALAFGVGWLVTPLGDLATGHRDEHYESPLGQGGFGSAMGWGASGVIFGIAALVLSFLRLAGKARVPSDNNVPGDHPLPEEVVNRT